MKIQKTNAVDKLVSELTSFHTWNEMRDAMKSGYIPTLNGGKAYAKLAAIVRRNGFTAYRGGIVA